jgi:hypothetical protein
MSIAYTYEIIKIDETARCMEIVYSAEGYQTMHIGARLPFEGESLLSVISMFAPVGLWVESSKLCVAPAIGARGVVTPEDVLGIVTAEESEDEREARLTADMWAQVDFEKRVASALVKLGVLSEDPTSIPVAEL